MRKYLVIILCLYLCSCVVKLDGNDSVSHFPIPQKKKSITLIFNNPPSVEHAYETMKKRQKLIVMIMYSRVKKKMNTILRS